MANLCEKLLAGCIGADCDNQVFEGMETKAYIFNKSDIVDFTKDPSTPENPNLKVAIELKSETVDSNTVTATGYTITQLGKTPFTGTNTTLNEGNIANTFTETVQFVVPDNSPAAAMLLDNIANGKFVVVGKNSYDGSDKRGQFQIYGAKKGLVCTAMERQVYSDDTNGGWAVTLTAEKTPTCAMFLEHKTNDDVDTESYLDSLVSCS